MKTRKRLNWKLLLGLLVPLVATGAGVHGLHGVQVRRNARNLLTQAERVEKAGDLDETLGYLERYIDFRPDDAEGLIRYARVLETREHTLASKFHVLDLYERAVRVGTGRDDLRRKLIDRAMELERYSQAETHLQVLLRNAPNDGELNFLLGRCEEVAGRFKEASALYQNARRFDPGRVEAYARLAELLRTRLNDGYQADAVMDARRAPLGDDGLITRNGQSAAAYLARARYRQLHAIKDVDPAADVARAVDLAPDDADMILAAAEQARKRGDDAAARKLFERGLALHPNNPQMYQGLALADLLAGRINDAVAWFRKGIAAVPEEDHLAHAKLTRALVSVLLESGQNDPARLAETDKLIDLLDKGDGFVQVRPELITYYRAVMLHARGQWAKAARQLEEAQRTLAADPEFKDLTKKALLRLAQCYEWLGSPDQRFDAYRRAVGIDFDSDPTWVEARTGYAASLVELNRIDEAIEQYQIVLPREPRAGVQLAQLQLVQNLKRRPEQQRWTPVERTIEAVEKALGPAPEPAVAAEVAILRARTLLAQGKSVPARHVLEAARDRHPDEIRLWCSLADLAEGNGNHDTALTMLQEARQRLGDRVELRLARAALWSRRGGQRAEQVQALDELRQGEGMLPIDDRIRLWKGLVTAYGAIGREDRVGETWQRLAKEQPDDLGVRVVLFDRAIQARSPSAAEGHLEEIRRIKGNDGVFGYYCHARLMILQVEHSPGNLAPLSQALDDLEKAGAIRPNWMRVPLARGIALELLGRPETAVNEYQRAILTMGARYPEIIDRLLRLLVAQERVAEAAQIVRKLQDERVPLSNDLQQLAIRISYTSGDPTRAFELARSVIPDSSTDSAQLITLGEMRWVNGEDAEPTFRRAVSLDPARAPARVALILYLAGTGKTDKAEVAMREAEAALPAEQATLVLAQGHEALGHADLASKNFQKALTAHPDDVDTLRAAARFYLAGGRQDEAVPLLERIQRIAGSTDAAATARRSLALITASRGGRQGAIKALEMIGKGQLPSDIRTRARVLALLPSRAHRKEAIGLLEGLASRHVSNADDLAILAQLHEADGDWSRARERYLELISLRGKDPIVLARFIVALLGHGQTDEAEAYLARVTPLATGQPFLFELQARCLLARGKTAQAASLLTGFARGDTRRVEPIAMLLEQLGLADAAEQLYRQLAATQAAQNPRAALALAGFLGRQSRTKEAIDVLEPAWATCPPEVVSSAGMFVLFAAKADDKEQFDRIARRIEQAGHEHPDKVSIGFDLANVRILQGRFAETEAIFRAIHGRDKTHGAPLNNLAVLLALRGGQAADALALVNQAIALEGETPEILDTRALAYFASGQPVPAITDLENAIAVNPTPIKYFHLAQAYRANHQVGDAVRSLRKATELGLTAQMLHPLERASFHRIAEELAAK